jgi:hypothetical protein
MGFDDWFQELLDFDRERGGGVVFLDSKADWRFLWLSGYTVDEAWREEVSNLTSGWDGVLCG